MTVSSEVSSVSYAGDGVTLAFTIPFRFLSSADISVVRRDDDLSVTELTTGFSITGAGAATGTCTFTVAPAADVDIIISRAPELLQPGDYTSNDAFPAEATETLFDRQTFISQYLRSLIQHCITVPYGDSLAGSGVTLPSADSRANKYLAFGAAGEMELAELTSSGAITQSIIGALLYPRTAAEIAAGVTPTNYAYTEGLIVRYGATLASADNTTAINAAISVSANGGAPAQIPVGTWFGTATMLAGSKLIGAGRDLTKLKIPSGGTGNVIGGTSDDDISVSGLTADCTGAAAGSAEAIYFDACEDLQLNDIRSQSAPGAGLRLDSCHRFIMRDIHVDDAGASTATEWGMQIDDCDEGYAANLIGTNCGNRFVMVRNNERGQFFGITARNNAGTAFWFHDCRYCVMVGGTDHDDALGDSFVIENASVGCIIRDITMKDCGGHGASIASDTTAPIDCHFDGVYSDAQGECMAAISDQGTGFEPINCSIRNVKGRNPGRVTPSEGFALVNTVNCVISGSISDNTFNTMIWAVRETGSAPSGNRFEITSWVEGSSGYTSISASNSGVDFPRLEKGTIRVGDAALAWEPGTDGRLIMYDQAALTANRDIALADSWSGDRVRVVRISGSTGGPFDLTVNTSTVTLTVGQWADIEFDGANWNLIASGDV